MKTTTLPKIGDVVNVPLKSTSAKCLTVTHCDMTAEVNGAELRENAQGQWVIAQTCGGVPVNIALRVPCIIGVDSKGRSHAAFLWYDKWLGAHHRKIQFCREWETASGDDLDPEFGQFVDAALASSHGAASDADALKWWRRGKNIWEISQITGLPESYITALATA